MIAKGQKPGLLDPVVARGAAGEGAELGVHGGDVGICPGGDLGVAGHSQLGEAGGEFGADAFEFGEVVAGGGGRGGGDGGGFCCLAGVGGGGDFAGGGGGDEFADAAKDARAGGGGGGGSLRDGGLARGGAPEISGRVDQRLVAAGRGGAFIQRVGRVVAFGRAALAAPQPPHDDQAEGQCRREGQPVLVDYLYHASTSHLPTRY